MPTPTINYTDPTWMPQVGRLEMPPSPAVIVPASAPSVLPIYIMAHTLVITGQSHPPEANNYFSVIPQPPMGRQIILTFPPIYKERPAPTVGQIYPPPAT